MNADETTPCSAVAPSLEEQADGARKFASLRLELEQSRRDLDHCQKRLAQMDGLFAHVADAIFVVECDGRIVDVNPAASALLGYSKEEFLGMYPWDFVTSAARGEILTTIDSLQSGAPSTVQRECRSKNGEQKVMSLRLRRNDFCGRDLIVVTARDVTQEQRSSAELEKALGNYKRAEALLEREKKLLEMIAGGQSLGEIFEGLCRAVEEISSDSLATIMLLDPEGRHLRCGAAPSFPERWIAAVDGIEIGPSVGSCGTAAYCKKQVIVCDIATDPLWANYRELALGCGLRAGWATPIMGSNDAILGTFAIYSREPRSPTPQDFQIISQITHLAAVAIERKRAAEAVRASEKLARGQVNAFTRTVEALAMESDTDGLVGHVLRTITDEFNAHSSSVWRKDHVNGQVGFEVAFEGGELVTKSDASIVAVKPYLPIEYFWPLPEDFRTGKPAVLEDIRQVPAFPWRDHLLAQGILTVFCVPMLIAGQVEGVTGIRFTRKRTFRAEEVELAKALANQAMLAMELTRLSTQNRQTAIMAERNRVARDIHDTLAQGFTGVIVQLEAAEEAMCLGRTSKVSAHLERAGELARESLREARRSVQALRPRALEGNPLGAALTDLIAKMTSGTAVEAKLTVDGEPRELPPEWENNLLRIGQEVLTNALRHAHPTEFHVRLLFNADEISLHLRDNGCGFDPMERHEGFGLQGIRERTESMGGKFTIVTAKGQGAAISIVIPIGTTPQAQPG